MPRPDVPPGAATQELRRQGQSDDTAKQVICFAFDSFYDEDLGELSLPTSDAFANQVVETLATTPDSADSFRLKAEELYDHLQAGDVVSVVKDLGCA